MSEAVLSAVPIARPPCAAILRTITTREAAIAFRVAEPSVSFSFFFVAAAFFAAPSRRATSAALSPDVSSPRASSASRSLGTVSLEKASEASEESESESSSAIAASRRAISAGFFSAAPACADRPRFCSASRSAATVSLVTSGLWLRAVFFARASSVTIFTAFCGRPSASVPAAPRSDLNAALHVSTDANST